MLLSVWLLGCSDCPPGYVEVGKRQCEPEPGTGTDTPPVCTDPDGDCFTVDQGDCDDANPAVNPEAAEVCNEIDDDCDGVTDTDATDRQTWYTDGDGDGYGGGAAITGCERPATGVATKGGDCDDADAAIHPNATEVCNFGDDDCDGAADDGIPSCADTGVADVWIAGAAEVDAGGSFLSGTFGYDFTRRGTLESLCTDQGSWSATAAPACPDCDWAFKLAVSGTAATGALCDAFGLDGAEWDGFTASWGFAETYDWTTEDGTLAVTNALFYYSTYERAWNLAAYDDGTTAHIDGDRLSMSFHVHYYTQPYYTP